jgi:hypothetical protein
MTNMLDVYRLVAGAPDSALKKAIDADAENLARDSGSVQKLYQNYGDAMRNRADLQRERDAKPLNRVVKESK